MVERHLLLNHIPTSTIFQYKSAVQLGFLVQMPQENWVWGSWHKLPCRCRTWWGVVLLLSFIQECRMSKLHQSMVGPWKRTFRGPRRETRIALCWWWLRSSQRAPRSQAWSRTYRKWSERPSIHTIPKWAKFDLPSTDRHLSSLPWWRLPQHISLFHCFSVLPIKKPLNMIPGSYSARKPGWL